MSRLPQRDTGLRDEPATASVAHGAPTQVTKAVKRAIDLPQGLPTEPLRPQEG